MLRGLRGLNIVRPPTKGFGEQEREYAKFSNPLYAFRKRLGVIMGRNNAATVFRDARSDGGSSIMLQACQSFLLKCCSLRLASLNPHYDRISIDSDCLRTCFEIA